MLTSIYNEYMMYTWSDSIKIRSAHRKWTKSLASIVWKGTCSKMKPLARKALHPNSRYTKYVNAMRWRGDTHRYGKWGKTYVYKCKIDLEALNADAGKNMYAWCQGNKNVPSPRAEPEDKVCLLPQFPRQHAIIPLCDSWWLEWRQHCSAGLRCNSCWHS